VDVEGNGEKLRIAPTYLLFYSSMEFFSGDFIGKTRQHIMDEITDKLFISIGDSIEKLKNL
jgi:hypothetical protein